MALASVIAVFLEAARGAKDVTFAGARANFHVKRVNQFGYDGVRQSDVSIHMRWRKGELVTDALVQCEWSKSKDERVVRLELSLNVCWNYMAMRKSIRLSIGEQRLQVDSLLERRLDVWNVLRERFFKLTEGADSAARVV